MNIKVPLFGFFIEPFAAECVDCSEAGMVSIL